MNTIEWLQDWYLKQCDGDWEHESGVAVQTLDNPGWKVDVRVEGTSLAEKSFTPIRDERTEHDWISCKIESGHFLGYGGPNNLAEILQVFVTWAKA